MEISRHDDGKVRLQGDLRISEAEELRRTLIGELTESSTLKLDLSEVSSCDTATVQLLCSLRKSADRDGKQLQISAPSAALCEASAILGLSLEALTNVSRG